MARPRATFEPVVNRYPFDYDSTISLAWAYLNLGKKAEARALYTKALLIRPGDTAGLRRRQAAEEAGKARNRHDKPLTGRRQATGRVTGAGPKSGPQTQSPSRAATGKARLKAESLAVTELMFTDFLNEAVDYQSYAGIQAHIFGSLSMPASRTAPVTAYSSRITCFPMIDAPGCVTSNDVAAAPSSGCAVSPDIMPVMPVMPRSLRPGDAPGAQPAADSPFVLGQNYPNPHSGETTVPFTLPINADVHLDLFDQLGRKMAGVVRKGRIAGPQAIKLNLEGLGLPSGDYVYRLQVSTRFGIHQQAKQMTLA